MGSQKVVRTIGDAGRRYFQRLACLIATLCLLLAIVGCASSHPGAPLKTIRVMTYNIHHAEGLDGKVDVDRIAKLILNARADVVALQEVDRGVERTKRIDILTRLSDLTGMTYAFGKTIDYQEGDFGNGFLTRFPILEERNLLYAMNRGGEQRGLLQLLLEARGEEIVVMNTHLDHHEADSERVFCANEIRNVARRYAPRPVIVCGDFNDEPGSRTLAMMKEEFTDAWERVGTGAGFTHPADSAKHRIDYIFVSKVLRQGEPASRVVLQPISARVFPSRASDHLPLLVEFEFRTAR
ncbi:MAG: endonuclease/exonuclease/phosphatase family protein [Bacteroidota bacterium]